MRIKRLILLAASISLVALWGCSSSMDSAGSRTGGGTVQDQVAAAGFAGANRCIDCHQDFSWSAEIVQAFLGSKHVIHSEFINAESDPACLECHDPIGDGPLVEPYINPADVPAEGLAAVTCENCHGTGADHYGIGPIPNPNPDYDVCGQCHNVLLDNHIPHHPLANNILDNYKLSGHFTSLERAGATPASIRAKCSRCHSDEGFRMFYPQTANATRDELGTILDPKAPLTNVSPVQCRTCHDPHSGEMRITAVTDEVTDTLDEDGNPLAAPVNLTLTVYSAQFRTCTACHMVFIEETFEPITNTFDYALDPLALAEDLDTDPVGLITPDGRNNHYHGAMVDMVQSHFDNPGTVAVEGFNINAAAENACTGCHDPHAASKFEQAIASGVANEWGNTSGFHGDYQREAFTHEFSSAACMQCHNGTEFVKVVAGLDSADLDVQEARVVACVSCHDLQAMNAGGAIELGALRDFKDADGNLLNTVTFPSGLTAEGVGENQFCMTCHSGRSSKADVDNATPQADGTYRFVNIHYRAAGASLFGNIAQGGYEFDGMTYASKFEHVDSNDLCIECHSPHSGRLAITTNNTSGAKPCIDCHNITTDPAVDYTAAVMEVRDIRMNATISDYDGDGDAFEGMYYEVDTLKNELEAALVASGVSILSGYPYFGNITTITQLQAAYNLQVASKDPGSWAHNGAYTIQLLVDSLAALGQTTNSVTSNPYIRDEMGHFDAGAEAFRHWDEDPTMSTTCGRCHSSEGAEAFVTNGTVTDTDFKTYTRGISAGLACEACHLPDATAADGGFDGVTRSVTSVAFPNGTVLDGATAASFFANDSPLCMNCHQGRESGASIDAATLRDDGTFRFVNIHYYAAAASLFGSEVNAGYEYAGQTYDTRNTFPSHPAGFTTCAGCHLSDAPLHDFKPNVTSCTVCHGGVSFETLGLKPGTNLIAIQTLKDDLRTVLEASGVIFLDGYPYFDNLTTRDQLRAAYNWQVADKDPCGYIHNGDYIRQILYDSIIAMGGATAVARP